MSANAAFGALVGIVSYQRTREHTLLKAILSGLGSAGLLTLIRVVNWRNALLGYQREKSPLEEWSELYEEEAIEADLEIFDCHHHFWQFATQSQKGGLLMQMLMRILKRKASSHMFGSMPKFGNTFGYRSPFAVDYMADQLLQDIRGKDKGGHNVVGTMYLECGWKDAGVAKCMEPIGEAAFVADVHRQHPSICQGMVAFVDLCLGSEVEPALKLLKENYPLVKGIRFSLSNTSDPDIMGSTHAKADTAYDAKFREGFALLKKYDLVFDSWIYHVNIRALTDLAKAFPEQTIVCDHMGMPIGMSTFDRSKVFVEWKELMKELSLCKNVVVKLGGAGMGAFGCRLGERATPPSSDAVAAVWGPYVRHCLETFGVDRCMMESNFPVDKISCTYTTLWNAFKEDRCGLSARGQEEALQGQRPPSVQGHFPN